MDVLAAGPAVKHRDILTGVSQVGLTREQAAPQPPPHLPRLRKGSGTQGCSFAHRPFPEAFATFLRLFPPDPPPPAAMCWGLWQGFLLLLAAGPGGGTGRLS